MCFHQRPLPVPTPPDAMCPEATIQLDRCAAVAVTDSAKGNFTVDFNGRELKFKAENAGSCEVTCCPAFVTPVD